MSSNMHSSTKPTQINFWWCDGLSKNRFLEYDLKERVRAAAANAASAAQGSYGKKKDAEEQWLEDVKFGLAHINPLGEIIIKPNKYRLVMDMLHFQPKDITIKAVRKGIFVRAEHPDANGYIADHFYREYVLPHDIDPNMAISWMTPENILFIEAPKVAFDPNLDEEDAVVNEVPVFLSEQ